MENTPQQSYRDVPTSSPRSTPSSSSNTSTIKPLPPLPPSARAHTADEPYSDEESHAEDASYSDDESYLEDEPYRDDPPADSGSPAPAPHRQQRHPHHHYQSYTDSTPPTPNTDDVPLAHLLLHTHTTHSQSHAYILDAPPFHPHHHASPQPYPLDAPPSYSVAVRQSFRNTLVQYIPPGSEGEGDEEAGLELVRADDDVRHSVEKVVAMFVVAAMLLVVAGVLGWLALGSGVWA